MVLPKAKAMAMALALALALALASCTSSGPHSSQGAPSVGSTASAPRPEGVTAPIGDTTTSGGNPSGPQEVRFEPYSAGCTLLGTIVVTQTVSGSCTAPGVAGTSSYRCFAEPGSSVYDPCFAPPRATTGPLVCVADPAQPSATRFEVGALPTEPAAGPLTKPWAMRLSNGQSCVSVAAAWAGLGPFACPTPAPAGPSETDCRQPTRASRAGVTACQVAQDSSSPFRRVQVVTVWT